MFSASVVIEKLDDASEVVHPCGGSRRVLKVPSTVM